MKKTLFLLCFTISAFAQVVRPEDQRPLDIYDTRRPIDNVRVVQLPSKIKVVTVASPAEIRYVSAPAPKKVAVSSEFAVLKKEWDDELESSALEIALKYSYRLVTEPDAADDVILAAKKADVVAATKAAKETPSAMTRKGLEGAVNRMIAR